MSRVFTQPKDWHATAEEFSPDMRDLCIEFPPYRLYTLNGNAKKVYITEYNGENGGTLTAKVEPRFNDSPEEYTVYGVSPGELKQTNIGLFR